MATAVTSTNRKPAPAQLVLLPTRTQWRLDDDTRRIGRAGIARARAILAASETDAADRDLTADLVELAA